MDKPIKVEIPHALLPYLSDDPEKEIKILLVFELYREKKVTIRQAADILQISYREMEDLFAKNEVYLDFGKSELNEEFQYGFGSE
jgi:predicted HTH domain antitoxin